ncbi:MAG TPA: N-acetylmuramoyl-L-alanine amidase [Clostridiales bacterium]|nr:N-acetylmuramoyl-L-alanine amidase [Clostridiales bacterium]
MKINVDAGHGTNTAGKRTPPLPAAIDIDQDGKVDIKKGEQYREHYANVGVASLLVAELQRCGFEVVKTGFNDSNATDDPDTALTDRQRVIAKSNCDYSISIHFNAYGDGNSFNSAQGVGIYIHDKYAGQSEKLAQTVLKHLAGGTKQTNRGVNKQALAMCNCNALDTKAAILVELAFMTNLHEATTMMANAAYWLESAQEIARGVCEYAGIKYVPEAYVPVAPITKTSPPQDIKWLQERLKVPVTGIFDQKTRIAILTYADSKGWDWSTTWGYTAGASTIKSLAK